MRLSPKLWMGSIYLNLANRKYMILFKNYLNVDGKKFVQSEQDNIIKVKNT